MAWSRRARAAASRPGAARMASHASRAADFWFSGTLPVPNTTAEAMQAHAAGRWASPIPSANSL
jgi:hypothetical protein